ncbi:sigma factor-like helix-turn-helix DNA-binding protein [Acinetobacter towneri]|uniref:sigma factor-like helix-turn-helix DNA-binding protein n=1 Tax=Acinetobacter towneri TaxID=202956 RepID=UPI001F601E58|nr:sigma factor-like helix-turn-helix DNA-binding protein [Acinetobacter towneri]
MCNKIETLFISKNLDDFKIPALNTKIDDLILPDRFLNLVKKLKKITKFHAGFKLGETFGDLINFNRSEISKLPGIGPSYINTFEELKLLVQSADIFESNNYNLNKSDEFLEKIIERELDDFVLPERFSKLIKRLRNISLNDKNFKFIKTIEDVVNLPVSEVSSLSGVGVGYIETLEEMKLLLKTDPVLILGTNYLASYQQDIEVNNFEIPPLQTKLTDLQLPDKYLKLVKRLKKVSINSPNFNLGETFADLINLSISEVEALPWIGKSYIQNLKELKSFVELKSSNSINDEDKIDITSADFSNMRISFINIDDKFLKALEKYIKYIGRDNLSNLIIEILNLNRNGLEKLPGFGDSVINKLIEFRDLLKEEIKLILVGEIKYEEFESNFIFPRYFSRLSLSKIEKILLEDIDLYFDKINEEDVDILQRRWGFVEQKQTLEEIALDFNITRERIRQKESKLTNRFLQSLRISTEGLWEYIEPELNSDLKLKFEDFYSCFSSERDFYDFLGLICNQKDLYEYVYPEIDKSIFNTYFAEHGAPIQIEDLKEYLLSNNKKIRNFNNIIRYFSLQEILLIKDQYVWPKLLKKSEAIACILVDHKKGLPWFEVAKIVNAKGYSRYEIDEDRLDNAAFDLPDFIYLAGKGIYKHTSFINESISLEEIFNELKKYLEINQRNTYHLNECYLALPFLKQFDYYEVRYFVKNFGEDFGFYFNGRSQVDSISLERDFKNITQKDVIIEAMNRSFKPLTKVEVASLLKSKSIGHAGYYLDQMLEEGSIVQVERMLYTTPQLAYKNIDLNIYINAINDILCEYLKPVEPSIFKEKLNSIFSQSYSKYFYSSIARLYCDEKGWFRKQNLYSINPIKFNSLKSILDAVCDVNKSNVENVALLDEYVAITRETGIRAILNWKNTF